MSKEFEGLPQEVVDTPLEKIGVEMKLAGYPNLHAGAKSFFCDLDYKRRKYKKLSEKQEGWFRYFYAVGLGLIDPETAEKKTEQVGNFEAVYALFAKAKQKLKWPEIVLSTNDGKPVHLKLSGPNSSVPNCINVSDGRPYGHNVWYGRVTPQGVWQVSRKATEEELKPVRRLLVKMAEDPAGTAKSHALLTGRCCFCNKVLGAGDGDASKKSAAAGFGETCAKQFGLHEEWKKAVVVFDGVAA